MKLQDMKVIFINPDHNEKYHKRKLYMENFLKQLGFHDIVHYKSGNEQYPMCLTLATIDILKTYMEEPFLLLEDDIEYTGESLDIPIAHDVDAIYLGLSQCAGDPILNRDIRYATFEPYSDSQVRVTNMLSAHAIFYNSKRYKQELINVLSREYKYFSNDVSITHIQPFFNILATKKPRFFQSILFNSNETFCVQDLTKIQVDDHCELQSYICPEWRTD